MILQDGFHYSKSVLSAFPDPELAFKRRGAPFTFDAESFVTLVKAIKSMPMTTSKQREEFLYAPSFDHALKDPEPDAIPISSRNRLIIIEGNYTLLDQKPWNEIARMCEEKWFVDADREVVKLRLAQRHLLAGIETSELAAKRRAEENDLPNGDLIRKMLIAPDVVIKN
jgi:pantothenate kinase